MHNKHYELVITESAAFWCTETTIEETACDFPVLSKSEIGIFFLVSV